MVFTQTTNPSEWEVGSWYITKDSECLLCYERHDGFGNVLGKGLFLKELEIAPFTYWGFATPWIKAENEHVLKIFHTLVSKYINRPKKNKIYCDADKKRYPNVFKHTGFKIIKKEFFEKGEIWITNGKEIILWKFPEK
jgi:hypothetical protein